MRRLGFVVATLLAGCDAPRVGVLTDSTCPPTDKPTYDNFGQQFFMDYCLQCHSTTKVGAARNGAPATIDFDSVALIRENTSRIDKQAAFGVTVKNTLMPDADAAAFPSDAERVRLGEYIACIVGR
ncbi:MAG: hypothetical protein H0T79_04470 [Deltaproteobacteria bacterium]|nr:hypothetical protein [Deltaproteobacteria bacterium]